jgi:hypothetical protein
MVAPSRLERGQMPPMCLAVGINIRTTVCQSYMISSEVLAEVHDYSLFVQLHGMYASFVTQECLLLG